MIFVRIAQTPDAAQRCRSHDLGLLLKPRPILYSPQSLGIWDVKNLPSEGEKYSTIKVF